MVAVAALIGRVHTLSLEFICTSKVVKPFVLKYLVPEIWAVIGCGVLVSVLVMKLVSISSRARPLHGGHLSSIPISCQRRTYWIC